ncbi:MAG TPA: error-prone DNA polymerase [Gemmatimonadaceae bacterium]|nr:error-prone DNA polymerase [Gemmatimonadaceae bacterium]
MGFIELRAHSAFSFGDGGASPEALVGRAASLGYGAIGITDTADLGGIVRFGLEARRLGVKPIVGAELNVDGCPVGFLARSKEGFNNIASLVTRSRVGELSTWKKGDGKKTRGRPRVSWQQVAERSEGLQVLTGPASGPVASCLRNGDYGEAERVLCRWRHVFGDRLAVEVQLHHTSGNEAALATALIELAERHGVTWVICQEPRYIDNDSRLVHDVLTALRYDTTIDDALARGLLHPNGEWRLFSAEEMAERWKGKETGLEESERIASECDFSLAWVRPPLPKFPVPAGFNDDTFLREKVFEGAQERWGEVDEKQAAQLEHELRVIGALGFAGFFLVMWDAVHFAKRNGILCQGRGSAANSAVAYCLAITAVDPVKHGLLFERFLSEIRVDGQTEAPDIDVDIEHDRREEVLDYVYGKYNRAQAAITCIIQMYRGPNAIRDSMRAFGYPVEMANNISKRIHWSDPAEGAKYVETELAPKLGIDFDNPRGRATLAAMAAFEGVPRLRSTHVGGFVLSSALLGDYLPVEHTTMGRTIIQFDKDDLDAVGIPKFDFLGLGALSLVRRAFDMIEVRTGTRPEMYKLPQDDEKTYELIATGETIGTFQIESRAQIASVLHTKPDRLYDIVVQVALIRPGPIQANFVHPYTARRRGLEPVTYPHPDLEPILKRTQGIPIFQEQAMAIAMKLGGYSAAQADELRRTMGHIRKVEKLHRVLEQLRARMVERGVTEDVAAKIAEDLKSFANYGFPESHAWSFALIAYATGYLKAHYTAEFYAGLLNSYPMGFYPPSTLIHDARRHGLKVLPPCMCNGDWECTTEPTDNPDRPALRIGWRHIRGLGEKSLDALKAARGWDRFSSIDDVVQRAKLQRTDALHLARAGAFGFWEPDRRRAAWVAMRSVGDTLPLAPARLVPYEPRPLTRDELIFLDYFSVGISVSGHPMEHLRQKLRMAGVLDSKQLEKLKGGEWISTAGLVTIRQQPQSAKGTVFLLMEDEHGFINVIVSRKMAEEYSEVVRFSTFVLVEGKFERDGGVRNVIGRKFSELQVKELVHASRDFH